MPEKENLAAKDPHPSASDNTATPSQREIASGVIADSYPTGSGSPVSNVNVVALSNLTQDQLHSLADSRAAEGSVRFYRGIGETFRQTQGSNYFTADINLALGLALGGKSPTLVVVD